MTSSQRIEELLSVWSQAVERGNDLSVATLCRECPELADEVARRLATLRKVRKLSTSETTGPESNDGQSTEVFLPGENQSHGGESKSAPRRQFIGPYQLCEQLGIGGMGDVYAAEDPALGRRVAIKLMKSEIACQSEARNRFTREARAAAALNHDHIVTIDHVGEQDGAPFIVMPLLSGESLERRLSRESLLPVAEVIRIGREAAEGLAAAHQAGLIHRDIKPGNLWLEAPNGRVKILDFGLARTTTLDGDSSLTRPGSVLGTPAYMSPEQADGLPIDGRSDLFSLGCVLYQTATGERPFRGATLTAILCAVAMHHPPAPRTLRPELPTALSDLIERMVAKSPDQRPSTALAVASELSGISLTNKATSPVANQSSKSPEPHRRRWSWTFKLTISLTISFAALLAVLLPMGMELSRQSAEVAMRNMETTSPQPPPAPVPTAVTPPFGPLGTDPSARAPTGGSPAPDLRAGVDIRIWRGRADRAQTLRLNEPGALPLKPGDQFRIEAVAQRKAYLYLFWIDTEGKAAPVYPWQPGKWGARATDEQPIDELNLPATITSGFTISGEQAGMETLILLVRSERLTLSDEAIQQWFAGLPPQRPFQNPQSAVWFENGRIVTGDSGRTRSHFVESEIADPVLRIQELLKKRIGPLADYTAAVSFARMGKE
jgi:serine/threonine protein kinase